MVGAAQAGSRGSTCEERCTSDASKSKWRRERWVWLIASGAVTRNKVRKKRRLQPQLAAAAMGVAQAKAREGVQATPPASDGGGDKAVTHLESRSATRQGLQVTPSAAEGDGGDTPGSSGDTRGHATMC